MNFISICSGIEAASVAFEPLGWKAIAFSEIEPFPCAVLAHHHQDVQNFGDMTKFSEWPDQIFANTDLIVGGPPCQAFSVAGKRNGLNDDRGNLTLTYVELINHADAIRNQHGKPPVIVLYENVPGLLSDKTGAFGCFLGELAGESSAIEPPRGKWTNAGCVYGPKRAIAWRVLDAQYFGVAQRRRRVFVVASARTDIDPAAILFEFDGLRRDTAPRREARKVAPTIPSRSTAGGGLGTDFDCDGGLIQTFDRQSTGEYGTQPVASTVAARDYKSASDLVAQPINFGAQMSVPQVDIDLCQTLGAKNPQAVAHPIAWDEELNPSIDIAGTLVKGGQGGRHDGVAHPIAFSCKDNGRDATVELTPTLRSMAHSGSHQNGGGQLAVAQPVAYTTKLHNTASNNAGKLFEERTPCLDASSPPPALLTPMAVRRLTPVECERLQGFPDNYTNIPWRKKPESPDGPRYKALGNSWAVPNVRWIGERIQLAVEVAA